MKKNTKKEENYFKLKLVGERGQITIDKQIRESCNIEAGTPLLEIKVGKAIVLVQVDNMLENLTHKLREAFLNTGLDKENVINEIETVSREKVVKKHYPELDLDNDKT